MADDAYRRRYRCHRRREARLDDGPREEDPSVFPVIASPRFAFPSPKGNPGGLKRDSSLAQRPIMPP